MDKTLSKSFHAASSKFSTLSTNKYFLYFTFFLAISTVIGYLATNQVKALVFFGLIGLLVSKFTPNMSVVLLIAVLSTSLLVSMKTLREGMTDAESSTESTESVDNADVEDKLQPPQKKALAVLKAAPSVKKALAVLKAAPSVKDAKLKMTKGSVVNDVHQVDTLSETDDADADADKGADADEPEAMTSMSKSQNNAKGASNRIDYASTLESAYSDLEGALGSGGIKQLTKDTSALMSQQKELFQSMKQMAPLIDDAKSMLKGFDMKSLNGLASLATGVAPSAPAPV